MAPEPERGLSEVDRRLEATILDLLARRAVTSTICPSDAARAVAADGDGETGTTGRHGAT